MSLTRTNAFYLICWLPAVFSYDHINRIRRNPESNLLTLHSNQENKVHFWLLSRNNEEPIISQVTDEKLFGGSYKSGQTILLMPGYQNDPNKYGFVNTTATAYLEAFDSMVIAVFWDDSFKNYTQARAPVRDVALVLAQFLKRMESEESLSIESLVVAGYGMGAHIAGIAGRLLNGRISTMLGLDPMNPLFVPGSSDVLDKHSAKFVQVIHTSVSAEGIIEPLGHVDFYPNSGFPSQPGCGSYPDYTWTICSHNRSYIFYSETFKRPTSFVGTKCSSYDKFLDGLCDGNAKAYMGYETSIRARGIFYLQTRSSSPYGLGDNNVDTGKTQKRNKHHPDAESVTSSEEERVHFHLLTRKNKGSPIVSNVSDCQLFNGAYDPSKPTVLLIPGYLMAPNNATFVDKMVNAHLTVSDVSLIAIFWDVALEDYRVSSSKTYDVAVVVAQFIDRMVNEESMDLRSVTLIGHSSGAQIGGTAGRLIKGSMANVIGLDPARPLFMAGAENVIDRHSGDFVQIIHTGGTVLALLDVLGHVDFYVNSGLPPQPGCESVDYLLPISPFSCSCSHLMRVVDLYAESIGNPCAFPATKCSRYEDYTSGRCEGHRTAFMGYKTKRSTRGTFYLQTKASSPYGLGTDCDESTV
ncbi:hypothetical protein GE061_014365 [Apolygus lucorum]|uniref:Lipase domain-containing protein n=1 Tax=Apolygus lucorum TaxID=248454 RepID=A0A6A4JX99_APOLU|nr:hypothetical protein GE061_014365 [Apolygus lucorum]